MFCSRPFGRPPEVTGPYCSQTRSAALPPEAWLSSCAFACVMDAVLFGSHCTVTFLCAASYWVVSFARPALSAAVMAPVFGGSSALMTTAPPAPPLADEPPEEQAAAPARTASAVAASRGVLLRMECHLLCGSGPEQAHGDQREDEHHDEEQGADGHAVAVLVVLEGGLVHVQPGDEGGRAGAAVGEQQDRHEVLHGEDAGQDHDDPELRHQQRDVDREDAPECAQPV